jgi:hypothetical protein
MVGERRPRAARKPRAAAGNTAPSAPPAAEPPLQPSVANEPTATSTSERLRKRPSPRPLRTPRPVGPTEEPHPEGPGAGMFTERLQHLRYLQDFFHSPVPFDLRERPLESSSPPEEIMHRIGEVKYQVQVLQALLVVLSEEIEMLNSALPAELKAESLKTGHT